MLDDATSKEGGEKTAFKNAASLNFPLLNLELCWEIIHKMMICAKKTLNFVLSPSH